MSIVVIEHPPQSDAATSSERSTAFLVLSYPVELVRVRELEVAYSSLTISGIEDKKGFLVVDEARKEVKRLKVAVEHRREELKADVLERGRNIEAAARTLREPLEALEKSLGAKQKVITDEVAEREREAAQKLLIEKEAKLLKRLKDLQAINITMLPRAVEAMTDEDFARFLAQETVAHQQRVADEAQEKQRLGQEAEQQRQERQRLDEERRKLDEERADLETARQEQIDRETEAQRAVTEERNRLAREDRERQAQLEQQRQDEYDQQLQIEQARVKAEREEAERVRAEQLRPDLERLLAFADTVEKLLLPIFEKPLFEVERMIRFRLAAAAHGIRQIINEYVK